MFITLVSFESFPRRYLVIIDSSDSDVIACEFCDDYVELLKVAESLKKKMG